MKTVLILLSTLFVMTSLSACGKKGTLKAKDQIYPRVYPNPACHKMGREKAEHEKKQCD